MAGNLKMTTSELTSAKNVISTQNTKLGDAITAIKSEVHRLTDGTWKGEAATAAQNKIDDFYSKTYQQYIDAVQGYITFIEQTVTRYDAEEDALKSNAAAISTDELAKFS